MTERIPRYFSGQVPPPPPPPPPPTHTARYGITAGVPGQQPYAFGYNYGRGFGLPDVPTCQISTTSYHSTIAVRKDNAGSNSKLSLSQNYKTRKNSLSNEPEKNTIQKAPQNRRHEFFERTASKSVETTETTTRPTAIKPSIEWTCKACNITLESEKSLRGHEKSHVKCSDCSFEGSPKIVKAHYQAKHGKFSGSGFKTITVTVPGCRVRRFKICVGNRPEDIQKWIEERKKKFPRSKASVPNNDTNTTGNTGASLDTSTTTATSAIPTEKTQKQVSPNSGLSSLLAGYGSSDDDDFADDDKEGNSSCSKIPADSSVPIIQKGDDVKDGDTASTTENGNEKCIPASPTTPKDTNCLNSFSQSRPQESKSKIYRPCRFFFRNGSCRNGDNCRFSHEAQPQNQNRSSTRAHQSKGGRSTNNNTKKRKRGGHISSDTLLRKLLMNDVERESTLSMQLLKFIVQNNFFLDEDIETKEKRQRALTSSDEPI